MSAMQTSLNLWKSGSLRNNTPGSKLLFGRMYEDWTIESSLFPPGGRVFCIASAGCTTLQLAARGHSVDAVDVNPAQVDYVKERLSGSPPRDGIVDQSLRLALRFFSCLGASGKEMEAFLQMEDLKEQVRYWKTRLLNGFQRRLVDIALSRFSLEIFYHKKFLEDLPGQFGRIMLQRLERGLALHPNKTNIFLQRLLSRRKLSELREVAPITIPPRVYCDDAVHYLESCPQNLYDGFSFSNILDGAEEAYAQNLRSAIRRSARPGAVIVLRSFREPVSEAERFWAAQDRAMLWGKIVICRRESLCSIC